MHHPARNNEFGSASSRQRAAAQRLYPAVNRLVQFYERTMTRHRGDTFTHETLATVARVRVGTAEYRKVIYRWRDLIEQRHHVCLISARNVGYRCPTGEEEIRHHGRRVQQLHRQAQKCLQRVGNVTASRISRRDLVTQCRQVQAAVRSFVSRSETPLSRLDASVSTLPPPDLTIHTANAAAY